MLQTADITLRALEDTDLDFLFRLENDADVWGIGSDTLTPLSRYTLRRYLDNSAADFYEIRQLRLVICANDEAVGTIDVFGFEPHHRRAAVGILVHKSERRHGYAAKALRLLLRYAHRTLHLHQLYCTIASSNEASLQLFRSVGFREVGVLKDWLRTAEGWQDAVQMQYLLAAGSQRS